MAFLPDTEGILGWTGNLGWNSPPKRTKLFTANLCQLESTWKKTWSLSWHSCINKGSSQCFGSLNTQVPSGPEETQRKAKTLLDIRKINTLIADDYTDSNRPVSALSDAAQNVASKSFFCKLGCSQAYHYLQMEDQKSVKMLAFSFARRIFAFKRLAQGVSRSLSAFSRLMSEYLEPVVTADQSAQYVDDFRIAANTDKDLTLQMKSAVLESDSLNF